LKWKPSPALSQETDGKAEREDKGKGKWNPMQAKISAKETRTELLNVCSKSMRIANNNPRKKMSKRKLLLISGGVRNKRKRKGDEIVESQGKKAGWGKIFLGTGQSMTERSGDTVVKHGAKQRIKRSGGRRCNANRWDAELGNKATAELSTWGIVV
jgi:hypothetical protein